MIETSDLNVIYNKIKTRGQRTAKVFNYLRDISFAAPEKTLGVEVGKQNNVIPCT